MNLLNGTYRSTLRRVFEEARDQANPWERRSDLTVAHFQAQYVDAADWAIGPFVQDDAMTFRMSHSWPDPLGIGWEGNALWNPTVINHDERLYLFYRCGPRKESLSSRIGLAIWTGRQWIDYAGNPVIYPSQDNEVAGVEDPKIYRVGDLYCLFYNGIYVLPGTEARLAVDINLVVSRDLLHWERIGPVVPIAVSQHWAKAAVIPRSAAGDAVSLDGAFLMFLSEGCGGQQYIGRSTDMLHWHFTPKTYLPLPREWGRLWEVACAVYVPRPAPHLVMDFFYERPDGSLGAGQAYYDIRDVTLPVAFSHGGTLAWGGLLEYQQSWVFAQGWDVPTGSRELYWYRAPVGNVV